MALEPITRQEKIIAGQDLTPITRMEMFLKQFGGGGGGLPTGGAPYQQLVTDGEGNVKWADRLAYGDSRVVIEFNPGEWFVHVSDDIGELNATEGAKLYFHFDDGTPNGSAGTCTLQAAGDLLGCQYCFIALTDNIDLGGIVLPKRGIYLRKTESNFVSSVANFVPPASDTDPEPEPVITWDGSTGNLKKIDAKYLDLPDVSALVEMFDDWTYESAKEILDSGKLPYIQMSLDWGAFMMFPCQDTTHFTSDVYITFASLVSCREMEDYASASVAYLKLVKGAGVADARDVKIYDLPRSYNGRGIIINSSTSGSSKKFKITVDDSGTISATEVT